MKLATLLIAAVLSSAAQAYAAGAPAAKCLAARNKAVGKYTACRFAAERILVLTGNSVAHEEDVLDCDSKLTDAWQKTEGKAAAAGATCPGAHSIADFKTVIESHLDDVLTALGGGVAGACAEHLDSCNSSSSSCATGHFACLDNHSACETDLTACGSNLAQAQGDLATCSSSISACLARPRAQPLKTGKTICSDPWVPGTPYSATPPGTGYSDIPCAGTGQDGESQKGAARVYVDHGNGTVTDAATGLMWYATASFTGASNWMDAFKLIRVLNGQASACIAASNPHPCCAGAGSGNCVPLTGYSDWRMPNIIELQSIVDEGRTPPIAVPLNWNLLQPTWTSTTNASDKTRAYYLSESYSGKTYSLSSTGKSLSRAVRPVRGGS